MRLCTTRRAVMYSENITTTKTVTRDAKRTATVLPVTDPAMTPATAIRYAMHKTKGRVTPLTFW